MSRYQDPPAEVLDLVDRVRREWFPYLVNAKIKVLFDTKKRMSGGHFVLGRIQATSTVMRHLTRDEAGSDQGFDYILYLDAQVWDAIDETDRVRLIRHELRHCFYDLDAKTNPYKIIGHDIEDFREELELNKDDPRWRERVAAIAASLYDQG